MFLDLLTAMSAVLATWAVLIAATIGAGALALRAFGLSPRTPETVLAAFWTGFAATVLALQVWNFLWPITWHTQALLLAVGAGGLLVNRRPLADWLATVWRERRWPGLLLIAVSVWLANRAIGPGDAHDSGLYHYQVIRWANEHPVVPGLANLAVHLGLNNSSLLHAAMMNTGPWEGRVNHIAPGFLLVMLFAQAVWGISGLLGPRAATRSSDISGIGRDGAVDVFNALLLVPAVMVALSKDASSPKTDLAPAALLFIVGASLIAFLRRSGPAGSDRAGDRAFALVFLTTMCSTAVCMKLTSASFGLAVWVLAALVFARREAARGPLPWKPLAAAVLLSAALVGPWIGRNIVMSGYPLYPSTAAAVNVDWRAPEENLVPLKDAIFVHPRTELPIFLSDVLQNTPLRWYTRFMRPPFDDPAELKGWAWVRPWFFTLPVSSPIEIVMPGAIVAAALVMLLLARRRSGVRGGVGEAGVNAAWFPVWSAPLLLALAAWFLSAPGPRFGFALMWLLAGGAAAAAVQTWSGGDAELRRRWGRRVVFGAVLLLLPTFAYRAAVIWKIEKVNPLVRIPFQGPGPDHGFHPKPIQPLEERTTRWGLTVLTPREGDPQIVWDPPLPASAWPPVDPDLRLRREGDLRSGFRIDRSRPDAR